MRENLLVTGALPAGKLPTPAKKRTPIATRMHQQMVPSVTLA
jgi:hypothetical protein